MQQIKENVVGLNLSKNIIDISYKELEPLDVGNPYKYICPECNGIILLVRERRDFKLKKLTMCVLCGQRYNLYDLDYE